MLGVFFGCTLLLQQDLKKSLEDFLKKAGVKYLPIGMDECCGIPLILSGYTEEAKSHARKIRNRMKKRKITTLVTHCPHCYTAFKHEYPEKLHVSVPFKVLHFSQFAWNLIKKGKIKPKKRMDLKVVYHDPCYIGRQGDEIYEESRNILKSIPGVKLAEFESNRDKATCCGGGGLLRAVLPRLSVEVAKEKIELQALPLNIDAVVSCCPFCDTNLKEGAEELKDSVKVYDLVNILEESL